MAAELELNAREDEQLHEDLEASISQYVDTCESARYSISFSYHDLVLAERAVREYTTGRRQKQLLKEVRRVKRVAKDDHVRHEQRGTCILERPKKEW